MQIKRSAAISADGLYRYSLERSWSDGPVVTFIMLNPSTADSEIDDPTIRRCINFAKRFGGGKLRVINLYALRATYPRDLWFSKDPVGSETNSYIVQSIHESKLVIAAWGLHAKKHRVKEVVGLMGQNKLFALGFTKNGNPRHPLYVRSDAPLVPFLGGK